MKQINEIPFSLSLADRIIVEYGLEPYYYFNWRIRGYIPALYVKDIGLITLNVRGKEVTKSLFYWKTRLGLSNEEIAISIDCNPKTVSRFIQQGKPKHVPKKNPLVWERLTNFLQEKINARPAFKIIHYKNGTNKKK
jgi:hypothetical protein